MLSFEAYDSPSGGKWNGAENAVYNLLHADDVMIFCGADATLLGYLKCVLQCFDLIRKVSTLHHY